MYSFKFSGDVFIVGILKAGQLQMFEVESGGLQSSS